MNPSFKKYQVALSTGNCLDSWRTQKKLIDFTCQVKIFLYCLMGYKKKGRCSHCFARLCVSPLSHPYFGLLHWPSLGTPTTPPAASSANLAPSTDVSTPQPSQFAWNWGGEGEKGKCVWGRMGEAGDSGVVKQHQLFSGFGCVSEVFWIIIWMYVHLSIFYTSSKVY